VGFLNGPVAKAEIKQTEPDKVLLFCDFSNRIERSALSAEIDIICALPRPQTLKKVLATSASMGVRRIYLVRANRVEKSYFDSPLLNPENYTRFLIEGLSQGGFTRLPEISIHHRFRPFFEDFLPDRYDKTDTRTIFLCPHPETLKRLNQFSLKPADQIVAALGPEGGWVPFELELMRAQGFELVRLGPWILRVENALTATIAQIESIL
jgi:RsmE family RNA methyltransferase